MLCVLSGERYVKGFFGEYLTTRGLELKNRTIVLKWIRMQTWIRRERMSGKVENKNSMREGEPAEGSVSSDAREGVASRENDGLDAKLVSRIEAEVARRFQSAKDKRWAALEKQYGGLHELAARMEGGSHQDKSVEEDFTGNLVRRANQLLERTGLGNDPEAVELIRELEAGSNLEGYVDLLEGLTELTLRRLGKGKATAGAVALPSGGNAPAADLQQAYEQQRKKLRPGDVNALMALKREFREKGLEIF